MIGIIDYKSGGNIHAFKNAFRILNLPYITADQPELLEDCNKIILPGVGSFDRAVKSLKNTGFYDYMQSTLVQCSDKKLLGVCVGLQVLCQGSEEGREDGLGIFDTFVRKFDPMECAIIPHMGWNSVSTIDDPIFNGIDLDHGFYFLHSYRLDSDFDGAIAHTVYKSSFTCAARSANCVGLQFHPEKSHNNGLQLIKNFLEE
jgi:imidazole glycerol-phosphate synthase subunit HisH